MAASEAAASGRPHLTTCGGASNIDGLRLLCTYFAHNLAVANIHFKHPHVRTATWLSPGGGTW